MKIIVTESQFNTINENAVKRQNLCATFGYEAPFCSKIEKIIKDGRKGGKDNNMVNLSSLYHNYINNR